MTHKCVFTSIISCTHSHKMFLCENVSWCETKENVGFFFVCVFIVFKLLIIFENQAKYVSPYFRNVHLKSSVWCTFLLVYFYRRPIANCYLQSRSVLAPVTTKTMKKTTCFSKPASQAPTCNIMAAAPKQPIQHPGDVANESDYICEYISFYRVAEGKNSVSHFLCCTKSIIDKVDNGPNHLWFRLGGVQVSKLGNMYIVLSN